MNSGVSAAPGLLPLTSRSCRALRGYAYRLHSSVLVVSTSSITATSERLSAAPPIPNAKKQL